MEVGFFCCVSNERMRGNDLKTLREVQIRIYSWCSATVWLWYSDAPSPVAVSHSSGWSTVQFHRLSHQDQQLQKKVQSLLCHSACSCSFSQAWSSRVIETNSSHKEWVVLMVTVSGRAAAPGISFCQHWAGVSVLHFKTLFQGLEPDTGYQMWFLLYLWLSSYGFLLWFSFFCG